LTRLLGENVRVVPSAAADVVVRDADASDEAFSDVLARTPTIVLVRDPTRDGVLSALAGGASAVLARDAGAEELSAAVDAVAAGLVVLDAAVRDDPAGAARALAAHALAEPLTERERQVLAMLAGGRSNRGIAELLAISENTVKAHVGAILAKLGAVSRTEAVALGVRLGLVML